jgi:hypothetical protein
MKKNEQTVESVEEGNKVRLCGTIVNRYETDRVIIITLGITEPGRFNPKTKTRTEESNYPKIYFFKDDKTGAENFLLYDKVMVEAHISAPRKKRPDGSIYVSQAIVGEKCEKARNAFEKEFGVKGIYGHAEDPMNVAMFSGNVVSVKRVNEYVTNIEMDAKNKRFNNYITITSFNKNDILIAPGSMIHVYAKIITKKKEKNGQKRFYENVVASKIIVDTANSTDVSES